MSIYANYQYDIVVSYAYVDNEIFEGTQKGWVTNLVNILKTKVAQKLGRADAFSLWIDYEKQGTLEHLKSSATLVVILSPGYLLSSQYLELSTFLEHINTDSGRVFVVEYSEIEERPSQLNDLRGYRFWSRNDAGKIRTLAIPQPNPHELEYYNLIEDLGNELVGQLKQLKATTSQYDIPHIPPRTTVFLAEVTDDLQDQRNQIKRYLEQYNIQIVPDNMYFFPENNTQLQQAITADLQKSTLFIQLLSQSKPFRPPGMSTPLLQYEYAKTAKLPILQWCDPQLDLDTITDSTQKNY